MGSHRLLVRDSSTLHFGFSAASFYFAPQSKWFDIFLSLIYKLCFISIEILLSTHHGWLFLPGWKA